MPVNNLARVSRPRRRSASTLLALVLAGALAVLPLTATPAGPAGTGEAAGGAGSAAAYGTAADLAPAAASTTTTTSTSTRTAATSTAASTTAAADDPLRVAVFMPFENGGRTGLIRPADHTPRLLGGFSWDLHKGPGAPVRANMSSPDGVVSLKVARLQNNSNGAGTRVLLDVRVNGTLVGQIQYGHLGNLQVSTSTPSFAPGTLLGYMPSGTRSYSGCSDGTSDGWPYSTAWRVCTPGGIHTHTDLQHACWGSFDTYAVLPADEPIALMSTALPESTNARCNAAELAEAAAPPTKDGDFITGGGYTWRIAGGAPIWVSTWDAFGGRKPYTPYSDRRFADLPQRPAEGTFLRGLPSKRLFRIAGGAPVPVPDLTAPAGTVEVDDAALDRISTAAPNDRMLRTPADGTFLRASRTGRVFVVAGGAPLYVSTLEPWGGGGAVDIVTVGEGALDNAGGSGDWSRMRRQPAEGTFLLGRRTGGVFTVAGGAPQWVDSWDPYGGRQPTVAVDDAAIDRAGGGGDWDRLNAFPTDGTVLRTNTDDRLYRVAGGAPIHLTSASVLEAGAPRAVAVSATVVDDAARADRNHAHLLQRPVDGTFVVAHSTGAVHTFVGGAPVWVQSWAPYGGRQPTVRVDEAAIDRAGATALPWGGHVAGTIANGSFVRILDGPDAGRFARAAGGTLLLLRSCDLLDGCAGAVGVTAGGQQQYVEEHPAPVNGTVLRFLPSGDVYRIEGTRCYPQAATAATVTVNDGDHPCLLGPPSAPGAAQAVAGDRTATVTWTVPTSDGGRDLLGYVVTGRAQGSSAVVETTVPAGATRAVLTGLVNGTAYVFSVRATNEVGTGPASTGSAAVVPAGVPGAVTGTTARPSANDVDVAWDRPRPNGSPVQQLVVTATGPGATRQVTLPGDATRVRLEDLARGTWTISVVAVNAVGTSAAGTPARVGVTAAPPGRVPPPQVVVDGSRVGVTWAAPVANGAAVTGYVVTLDGVEVAVGPQVRTWTFEGVAPGRHEVGVVARNAAGSGVPTVVVVEVPAP